MKIALTKSSIAHVNFAGEAKVSIISDSEESSDYFVKWFRRRNPFEEYEFIGEMVVTTGTWGSHFFEEIEQWKVEFWKDDKLIRIFDNHLANKDVILVAKGKEGKAVDFELVKKYCTEKVNEFNCNLKVYFEGSSSFDFSNLNFNPLRLNDDIPDMYYGLEKEF